MKLGLRELLFLLVMLGVLGMVKGIPSDLKVFLLTLAIADDIGAIIVIAVFYSGSLDRAALFSAIVILALIFVLLKIGISRPISISFWELVSGWRFCDRESTPP